MVVSFIFSFTNNDNGESHTTAPKILRLFRRSAHKPAPLLLSVTFDFKNLEIYHLAHQFVLDVYAVVSTFPDFESNNLTSQLRRAATCLPLNIAEGSGAKSDRIFLNYLVFAYRSTRECEAAMLLCKDLNYLSKEQFDALFGKLDLFTRKLYKYMQYLEDKVEERKRTGRSYYYMQHRSQIDNDRGNMSPLA